MNKKILGTLILALGIVTLFGNFTHNHHFYSIFSTFTNFFWPLFFFILGLRRFNAGKKNSITTYALFFFALFFSKNILADFLPDFLNLNDFFWPITIILIGIIILLKPKELERDNERNSFYYYDDNNKQYRDFEDERANINKTYIYQKGHTPTVEISQNNVQNNIINNKTFDNKFAVKEINIKENDLKFGDNKIKINNSFGEIKVSVPKNINLKLDGNISHGEIMFLNKTYDGLQNIAKAKYNANNAEKSLHIIANVSFGEIKIYFAT